MAQKTFNKKSLIGIAVTLLVPLSFYVVVRILSIDSIQLPPYFHPELIKERQEGGQTYYDTVYHQMQNLQLTNQFGELVHLSSDFQGKILVLSFLHTGDTTTAHALTRNILMLQKAFKKTAMKQNDTLVHFLTVTTTPESDSPHILRNFAEQFSVNQDHWWFLTGKKEVINRLRFQELGLSNLSQETIVLIDKDRFIRGYYQGLAIHDLSQCATDIGWLVLEKKRKK